MTKRCSPVVLAGVVIALASAHGCSATKPSGAPTGGSSGATGMAGTPDASGAAGAGGVAGAMGAAGASGAGAVGDEAIKKTSPTMGCGTDPGQPLGMLVMHQLQTMGVKDAHCADSKCGAWSYVRDYWIKLPAAYQKDKAYPLVLEGPGCGGQGTNVYASGGLDADVVRVTFSPPPNDIGHSTSPGQSCFDDHEGDDSVEWAFYETLYDHLAETLCFDRNRVFASGDQSGGTLANELGCKYAGDAARPIRGVMVNSGTLPTEAGFMPTCTDKPMAGLWSHAVNGGAYPFAAAKVAIARAMRVNHCTLGTGFDDATFDPFPIGNDGGNVCEKLRGCPDLFPLVVCPLPASQDANTAVVAFAWPAFIKLFPQPAPP